MSSFPQESSNTSSFILESFNISAFPLESDPFFAPVKLGRKPTADTYARPQLSNARRYSMLALFCCAEFLDTFAASCLLPAITEIQTIFDLTPTELSWVFASYSATFSAFLLVSGRLSDVYSSSKFHFPSFMSPLPLGRLSEPHVFTSVCALTSGRATPRRNFP